MDDILLKYFQKKCIGKAYDVSNWKNPNLKSKEEIDKWFDNMDLMVKESLILIAEMDKEKFKTFTKEKKQDQSKVIRPQFNTQNQT